MKKINLLIADDHPMIRNGVRLILESQSNYIYNITEASTGEETLFQLENQPIDVLVLDISMKKLNGIEVLKKLKHQKSKIPVVIQTMHEELSIIKKSIDLGAKGYILKISDHNELLQAVEHALDNKPYFSKEVSAIMFATFSLKNIQNNNDGLTERELEVLLHITDGLNNQQIADILFISKRTVEGHKKKIYEKTKTHSTQSIINYALKHKLIEPKFQ